MRPSPSHPISKIIRFGIKISKFIDKINNKTNILKRTLNFSEDMYIEANRKTFIEINNTTKLNKRLYMSIITGRVK